jgi:hypothetical protein
MSRVSDFVKTGSDQKIFREILDSPVSVLLGVSGQAEAALRGINVQTVLDLAFAPAFTSARDIVMAAADPQGVFARHGSFPRDHLAPLVPPVPIPDLPKLDVDKLNGLTGAQAGALRAGLSAVTIRDLALWLLMSMRARWWTWFTTRTPSFTTGRRSN